MQSFLMIVFLLIFRNIKITIKLSVLNVRKIIYKNYQLQKNKKIIVYNQVKFIHARKCKAILALNVNQGFIYMQKDAKKELI